MPGRGELLFTKQCGICHGDSGDGQGKFAYLMNPRPRNFHQGNFKLATTQNQVPTDKDLLRTIRRGMPGSAMPPWGHLPESDLDALVQFVRRVHVEAVRNELQQAVAAAIEASDAPQTLMDASRAAHIVLVTASQQGLAQAEDQLQGVTGMYQDELQRLDELVACAWSEEQLKVFCTTLEASGFSDITTASISNRDYLMGWSLTARR